MDSEPRKNVISDEFSDAIGVSHAAYFKIQRKVYHDTEYLTPLYIREPNIN